MNCRKSSLWRICSKFTEGCLKHPVFGQPPPGYVTATLNKKNENAIDTIVNTTTLNPSNAVNTNISGSSILHPTAVNSSTRQHAAKSAGIYSQHGNGSGEGGGGGGERKGIMKGAMFCWLHKRPGDINLVAYCHSLVRNSR